MGEIRPPVSECEKGRGEEEGEGQGKGEERPVEARGEKIERCIPAC